MRFLLTIRFIGTNYNGLQRQLNTENTIQGKLEHALSELYQESIPIVVASRLDKGVHATDFKAHFDTENNKLSEKRLIPGLNRHLPKDIRVSNVNQVDKFLHARHDSKGKVYRYKIYIDKVGNPFIEHDHLHLYQMPDLGLMKKAAKKFEGKKNFKAFMNGKSDVENTVRTVKFIKIIRNNNIITIDIKADGFLYNMARIIVGCIIDIGYKKYHIHQIDFLFRTLNRDLNITVAKAKGLTLIKTIY